MKRKLLLILIVALAAVGIYKYLMAGTTYHIGSDVTDDYASWTAMQVAVQEEAGDTVSFRRDETFREQITVPNSGSLLSRITYTAHGSGADPIINGSDLVETWTAHWGTLVPEPVADADNAYIKEATEDVSGGSAGKIYVGDIGVEDYSAYFRFQLNVPQGATINTSYLTLTGSAAENDGCDIDLYAEDVDTGAQITDFAEWTTAIGRKTSASANWDMPAIVQDTGYNSPSLNDIIQEIVDRGSWVSGNYINILLDESGSSTTRPDFYSNAGATPAVLHVEWGETNTWSATLATEPNQIFLDSTRGNIQTAIGDVDSENDWFWASNILYVYATEDPDTAYDDPGIEASVRDNCIYANVSYITIDGITCKYSNTHAIIIAQDYAIIKNCLLTYPGGSGVYFYGNSTDITYGLVQNCTANYSATSTGILTGFSSDPGPSGVVIEENTTHNNGSSDQDHGIYLSYSHNCIVRRNITYANKGHGIALGVDADDNSIYCNLSYENDVRGIIVNAGTGNAIYNNVFFNNTSSGIFLGDAAATNIFKNNIFYQDANIVGDTAPCVRLTDPAPIDANTWDNNCYVYANNGSHGNSPFTVDDGGVQRYTLAEWQGLTGTPDLNSITSDPLMTDPANGDFTLQFGSPCIDAGVDVGLTEDYAGNSVFAPKVILDVILSPIQNPIIDPIKKNAVDIGAYEYQY